MGGSTWKKEELDVIASAGDRPFPETVSRLHALERERGWVLRSEGAIRIRLYRQNIYLNRYDYDSWRPEETRLVKELVGFVPFPDIVKRLQKLERQRGWDVRSEDAVRGKIVRMKLRIKPQYDSLNACAMAAMLGVDPHRVYRWISTYGLPARKVGDRWCVKLRAFSQWAKKHPKWLAGVPADRLEEVVGGKIPSGIPARSSGYPRRVRIVETGQEFASMRQAAIANHISSSAIWAALETGGTAGGVRWEDA